MSYFFDFGIDKPRKKEGVFTAKGIKQFSSLDDRGIFCSEVQANDAASKSFVSTHHHTDIELIYSLDASIELSVNNERYMMTAGDLIVISPGEHHTHNIVGAGRYYSIKLLPNVLFSSDRTFSEYKYFNPFLSLENTKRLYRGDELSAYGIAEIINDIMREWAKKSSGYELMIRADVLKIFTVMARFNSKTEKRQSNSLPNDAINIALSYISDNFASVSEQDVAEHCGLSLAYFSTLFKNTVGQKFGEYLLQLKISRAKSLLLTTDKSITYIAYETGFSSSSHFIARFRELENTTPAQYRRKAQKEGSVNRIKAPAVTVRFKHVGQESGHLLIFKYRTNRADDPPWMPMFLCTERPHPIDKDLSWTMLKTDEKWHVIIMDVNRSKQLVKNFVPSSDGKFYGSHVHFHLFYKVRFPSQYIDLAYVAYAENFERAFEIIGDGEDVSLGYFEDDGPSRWIELPLSLPSPMPPRSVPSKFYRDAAGIFSDAASNGVSLRKTESLKEEDTDYTRIWCP